MAEPQASQASEQLVESLGKKVETFLKGLSPDEMKVFTASLLTPPTGPDGQDAQGFLDFPTRVRPSLPPLCSWQFPSSGTMCWVCGTRTMHCQSFG